MWEPQTQLGRGIVYPLIRDSNYLFQLLSLHLG